MRTMRLILLAAVLAPAVGCSWIKGQMNGDQDRYRGVGPLEPRPPEDFVAYLNLRAGRLQSIEYKQVHMRVSGKDIPVPVVNLDGNLAAAQGRHFRMTGSGRALALKVDLGSNPEQFWLYLQAPGDKPRYVFASHTDFDAGRAEIPGGIPFEPDWVMQALGMVTLPPTNAYERLPVATDARGRKAGDPPAGPATSVPRNDRDRTYTLAWPVTTPTGQPVRKEIVFDADPALGTRPQVKRHLIRDPRGKLLASAEVKAARTVQLNNDPRQAVQYPTHLVLRWEEQKFEMDLTLEQGQERAAVNQLSEEQARRLFTRRDYPNVSAIDLAGGALR